MSGQRRERILNELQESYNRLWSVYIDLENENKESQFDFCTSARLSDLFDSIESVVKRLDKIIYQK